MIVPLAARWVAAVCGILLLLTGWSSIIGTLIVPRPVSSWMTRWVDRVILATYRLVTRIVTDFRSKDRILATQAAAILITQLLGWLAIIFVGYTFLLWPITGRGIASAFIDAGSSIFTLGFSEPQGAAPALVVFLAAGSGLVIVALQIGYLPTLYAAFNRRETEVALLNARGGFPAWGPELLARTHYGLGTGSTINTLPELYMNWERWAADVGESHSTYLPLVRFRSPRELTSWVTSLLAVLDSAALILTLAPEEAPTVPARLCLRGGFQCFSRIARAMGFELPDEANPEAGIALTFEEFLDAVKRMREVGFPITRDPAEAWREFVGWRVNYEQAAYRIAEAVDAVPALWSGPRHYTTHAIAPIRPPLGRPGKLDDSSYAGAHDRHVAHRQRTAGLAHLPAAELAASGPAEPPVAARLRALAAGVRGARAAQRGAAAAAPPVPDLRGAELGAEPPVPPAHPHAAAGARREGRLRGGRERRVRPAGGGRGRRHPVGRPRARRGRPPIDLRPAG